MPPRSSQPILPLFVSQEKLDPIGAGIVVRRPTLARARYLAIEAARQNGQPVQQQPAKGSSTLGLRDLGDLQAPKHNGLAMRYTWYITLLGWLKVQGTTRRVWQLPGSYILSQRPLAMWSARAPCHKAVLIDGFCVTPPVLPIPRCMATHWALLPGIGSPYWKWWPGRPVVAFRTFGDKCAPLLARVAIATVWARGRGQRCCKSAACYAINRSINWDRQCASICRPIHPFVRLYVDLTVCTSVC